MHGYDVARPSDLFIEFNTTALIGRISQGELDGVKGGEKESPEAGGLRAFYIGWKAVDY